MKTLIIVPAYNEELNIEGVIQDLRNNSPKVDILVINDCSRDSTVLKIENLNVIYLDLPVNLGIGGAVQTGLKYAANNNYDVAVQFDGDGQHEAQYVKSLLEALEKEKADLVVGSRFLKNQGFQSTGLRRMGIVILSKVIKLLCNVNIKDVTSGMRAFSKRMIRYFAENYVQDYPEPEAVLMAGLLGAKVVEVPVEMRERQNGKSSISSLGSLYYMVKVILSLVFSRVFTGKEKSL